MNHDKIEDIARRLELVEDELAAMEGMEEYRKLVTGVRAKLVGDAIEDLVAGQLAAWKTNEVD